MTTVLLSLFNRKGGEGIFTKIITKENNFQYEDLLFHVESKEIGLIVSRKDLLSWVLITDKRVILCENGDVFKYHFKDIVEIRAALNEEFQDGILDKQMFSRIYLKTMDTKEHIIQIEPGLPFQGVYQVLHFIGSQNKVNLSIEDLNPPNPQTQNEDF